MAEKALVAGAGFAGLNAALRLSRKGFDVTIIDLKECHEFTPSIIDLFRDRVSGGKLKVDLEQFLDGTGIDFEHEVIEGINPENNVVYTGGGDRRYDNLVIALGGEPYDYGLNISDAYPIYSLEDVRAVDEELEGEDEAIIVGAGYVGVETAGELTEKGIEVTVLDKATRPMLDSPKKASHLALEYMNRKGIRFMGGKEVIEVRNDGVKTADGIFLDADLVIWAGGVEASKVVQNSFGVNKEGLSVNSGFSSKNYENVFAVGDCSDSRNLKTAHNAMKEGRVVAENVVKGSDEELESYKSGKELLVVSLGDTGILIHGDRVMESRFFRFLKDLVRLRYFLGLRMEKLKARVSV